MRRGPDAGGLYELIATGDPLIWQLPVTEDVCAGAYEVEPFLYGGMALAAGIGVLERVTGRAVIRAQAQFASAAALGERVDLVAEIPVTAAPVAQARVTGLVAGREVFTITGACGPLPGGSAMQWRRASTFPAPEACEQVTLWPRQNPQARVRRNIEVRMRPGEYRRRLAERHTSTSGRIRAWGRVTGAPLDAGVLALLADFVPASVVLATGRLGGGSSLDNTLRILQLVPTDWVRCEIHADGLARGMGHGSIHLYARTGELLAIGSQSFLQRYFDE